MSLFHFSLNKKPNTALHTKYKTLIEPVKKLKGKQLYQFRNLLDMPHNRYNYCTRFTTDVTLRLDRNDLENYIENQDKAFNNGDWTKAIGIFNVFKAQSEKLLSIDASYRLASCVYFWEDENLDDYDFEIGDEKIKLFKELGFESFFLKKPMNNFIPQMNISAQDLAVFSQIEKEQRKLMSSVSKKTQGKKEKMTS